VKFKALSTAMAALSLVVAPTVAAAQPVVTPLTQQAVAQPASETVEGDNALFGGGAGFFVLILAIGAITLGIIAATSGSSRPGSAPTSP
jgi:hypothetical protein